MSTCVYCSRLCRQRASAEPVCKSALPDTKSTTLKLQGCKQEAVQPWSHQGCICRVLQLLPYAYVKSCQGRYAAICHAAGHVVRANNMPALATGSSTSQAC